MSTQRSQWLLLLLVVAVVGVNTKEAMGAREEGPKGRWGKVGGGECEVTVSACTLPDREALNPVDTTTHLQSTVCCIPNHQSTLCQCKQPLWGSRKPGCAPHSSLMRQPRQLFQWLTAVTGMPQRRTVLTSCALQRSRWRRWRENGRSRW